MYPNMWSLNPFVYLRHAWNDTKTIPGTTALVLFYSVIWILIISSIVQVVFPSSQGMKCVLEVAPEGCSRHLVTVFFQGMNLFVVFFLFYADRSGLHSWNVGMVTTSFIIYLVVGLVGFKPDKEATPLPAACFMGHHWAAIFSVFIALLLVALGCTIFEEREKERSGTAEERQNLL